MRRWGSESPLALFEELLQMLHQEGGLVSAARRAIVRQAIRQLVDETEFSFADEQLQDAADQFHRRDWLLTSFEMNRWLSKHRLSLLGVWSVVEQQWMSQFLYTVITSSTVRSAGFSGNARRIAGTSCAPPSSVRKLITSANSSNRLRKNSEVI